MNRWMRSRLTRWPFSPQSFARFARFITGELGIKMSERQSAYAPEPASCAGSGNSRLRSLDEYQEYLFNSPDAKEELVHFIDAVTTNKTDFFREPQHFDYLVRTALPELSRIHGGTGWRLKLWCAGCSSGEEPYTLAMVLSEYAQQHPGFDFSILATDISTKVLDHAQTGIYEEACVEPVPLPLRQQLPPPEQTTPQPRPRTPRAGAALRVLPPPQLHGR